MYQGQSSRLIEVYSIQALLYIGGTWTVNCMGVNCMDGQPTRPADSCTLARTRRIVRGVAPGGGSSHYLIWLLKAEKLNKFFLQEKGMFRFQITLDRHGQRPHFETFSLFLITLTSRYYPPLNIWNVVNYRPWHEWVKFSGKIKRGVLSSQMITSQDNTRW